jgi:hypothetical protein
MKKVRLFFWITWVNIMAGFIEVFSGFLLWLILPYGSKSALIWNRMTWISIHKWGAIPITLMVLVHVAMHWKWIANQTKSLFRMPVKPRALFPEREPNELLNPDLD